MRPRREFAGLNRSQAPLSRWFDHAPDGRPNILDVRIRHCMQGLSKPRRNPETTLLRSDDAGEGKLLPLDEQLEQSSTSIGNLMIDDRDRKQAHTRAKQLVFIRSTTRLSVTELARTFSVTRQIVHEWCQGATARYRRAAFPRMRSRPEDVYQTQSIPLVSAIFRDRRHSASCPPQRT